MFFHRIPSATQSDSVRRPIGFRPPSNRIPSAVRLDGVRCTMKNCRSKMCKSSISADFKGVKRRRLEGINSVLELSNRKNIGVERTSFNNYSYLCDWL